MNATFDPTAPDRSIRPPEPREPGEGERDPWLDLVRSAADRRWPDHWWDEAKEQIYARRIAGDDEDGAAAAEGEAQADADATDAPAESESDSAVGGDSWWDLTRFLFYVVLIALCVRTLLFQPYNIPSGSMESTLLVGDYLFVEKFAYGYSRYALPFGRYLPGFGRVLPAAPARGDVVVFVPPADPSIAYIKRVVGLPGDRIRMEKGVLYVNGQPVPKLRVADYVENRAGYEHHIARYRETLPGGKSHFVLDGDPSGPGDDTETFTVPAGSYFMMGDNRDDSNDSRMDVGYVPAENLIGKAQFRFFSIDVEKAQWRKIWTWPRAIRFDRMFTVID